MTENMMKAGISALLESRDKKPEDIVADVCKAVANAKQNDAMKAYWEGFDNERVL